ncbi:MAG TPA: hypothetical protein VLK85_13005 [Ramlibacter sp.]|nr:hypothetical protein [Ramlibacter sp.]
MLVQITENVSVAPDQVATVEIMADSDWLWVKMKDGAKHGVGCDYGGKSIYDTRRRIVAALTGQRPELDRLATDLRNAYESHDREAFERGLHRLTGQQS